MVLKTHALKKTYDGKVEAVRGIDIQVEPGEIYGFLGPNGAGKSTSMKMFTGLLRPTEGSVEILGSDLRQNYKEIKKQIGYVPQDLIYFDHLTVQENLELFAACYEIPNTEERITEVLKILQIEDLRKRKSSNLSGGQRRRLNLAIGLLNSPRLLFLDEPAAGMDPQSRRVLWDSIRQIVDESQMSIVLTTHLMETLDRLADRIAIIDHGVIQVIDTPKNLKETYSSGEMIQIALDPTMDLDVEEVELKLKQKFPQLIRYQHNLRISTDDAVELLSEVVIVTRQIVPRKYIQQISINETTLEDVFIKITGSALRE